MKVALIPPRDRLHESELLTGYHLLLPEHCSDEDYRAFYQARRAAGDFLILDNGACEGNLISSESLMRLAKEYMVNEIVVPDVLGDMEATIKKAEEFERLGHVNSQFNYMAVLQGKTIEQFKECAEALSEMTWISTFAVPRHIETTCLKGARLEIVSFLWTEYDDHEIHLLGLNPKHIFELGLYGTAYNLNHVRGVDTATPYYYAMKGQYLNHGEAVTREVGYFDFQFWIQHEHHIQSNIAMLKMWAGR